ncbi:MAG: hypothetical protein U9R08_03345 [Nanoarchaeota archaeon]|nr:hypothetical protein [Nanoarchaeota archaeon]
MKTRKNKKFFVSQKLKVSGKTTIFGLLALMIVGVIFSTSIVSAYRGDYSVKGPDYTEERHAIMEQAFADLDYNTWYESMTASGRTPRVLELVTEENFETFVKAHEAGMAGDHETAAMLRAELGLNNGMGPKDGSGYGKGTGSAKGQGAGQGQRMQQNNFIDANNDGNCDNLGQRKGRV